MVEDEESEEDAVRRLVEESDEFADSPAKEEETADSSAKEEEPAESGQPLVFEVCGLHLPTSLSRNDHAPLL